MLEKPISTIIHESLMSTPIFNRLRINGAVILERIARGGGNTRWFYCSNEAHLAALEQKLSAGSAVSFYFDNRITSAKYSPEIKAIAERIISETGEVLVGTSDKTQIEIDMHNIFGPQELQEHDLEFNSAPIVFFGKFPGRDNDGINAVTVILPDADGVVRPHPH